MSMCDSRFECQHKKRHQPLSLATTTITYVRHMYHDKWHAGDHVQQMCLCGRHGSSLQNCMRWMQLWTLDLWYLVTHPERPCSRLVYLLLKFRRGELTTSAGYFMEQVVDCRLLPKM